MSVSYHFQSVVKRYCASLRRYVKYHAFAFAFLWTAGRSPTYRCEMRTVRPSCNSWYLFIFECCTKGKFLTQWVKNCHW